jgi:hypothetical protein
MAWVHVYTSWVPRCPQGNLPSLWAPCRPTSSCQMACHAPAAACCSGVSWYGVSHAYAACHLPGPVLVCCCCCCCCWLQSLVRPTRKPPALAEYLTMISCQLSHSLKPGY